MRFSLYVCRMHVRKVCLPSNVRMVRPSPPQLQFGIALSILQLSQTCSGKCRAHAQDAQCILCLLF